MINDMSYHLSLFYEGAIDDDDRRWIAVIQRSGNAVSADADGGLPKVTLKPAIQF